MPTDPRGLRGDAPLFDAWLRFYEDAPTPFTIPGHKHRHDLVGDVVAGDVPLYAGLDSMRLERGLLAAAEARAAALWGADVCRFSVGGSTHANQALALAVGGEGDQVLVGRTLHRSMLLGLVLAGLEPVWLRPDVDPSTGLPLGVTPEAIEAGFRRAPNAVAVLVGDPSYVGTVGDVAGMASVAHAHGVPLVVDAAWGAHFGFYEALPAHAIQQGADAIVTSAHKTLPSWSQAALILARTERIDIARLDRGVEATHTTSPAGAILASIDAARALLAQTGASSSAPSSTASPARGLDWPPWRGSSFSTDHTSIQPSSPWFFPAPAPMASPSSAISLPPVSPSRWPTETPSWRSLLSPTTTHGFPCWSRRSSPLSSATAGHPARSPPHLRGRSPLSPSQAPARLFSRPKRPCPRPQP